MAAESQIQAVSADFLDPALYGGRGPVQLPRLERGTLLAALSHAFDLAESRSLGHAQRVAFVGLSLARELGVSEEEAEAVLLGCLLHDSGMASAHTPAPPAGPQPRADLAGSGEATGSLRPLDVLSAHTATGAAFAERLGLPESVRIAVASHHDYWDVTEERPLVARIVSSADRIESLLDTEGSPLRTRHRATLAVQELAGAEIDRQVAEAMGSLATRDEFWLSFHEVDLSGTLLERLTGPMADGPELMETLAAFGDLVDERNERPRGHSRRVADLAHRQALAHDLPNARSEMVQAAALLQDLGTLGVPAGHPRKPDLLTVDEMTAVQLHPTFARNIVGEIPGFGAAAWWVGCHHERVDGKGYPATLEGGDVPLEAQIIGICEAYVALTSDRPHRAALPVHEAIKVIAGLAQKRFSRETVERFLSTPHPLTN